MTKKIYVASSWRNAYQQNVVAVLRREGHEAYDFRHPAPGNDGFAWSSIDQGWKDWDTLRYREGLQHPVAQAGFKFDFDAMQWADTCVLVLPSGRSAHIEAGWMVGAGKRLFVYQPAGEKLEPELMYLVAGDCVCTSMDEVLEGLRWK